jgi:hypothetical protein
MKIEKCPFCDKAVAEITNCNDLEECRHFEKCPATEPYVCVVCNMHEGGCGASSGYYDSVEKAIAAWNRRANHIRDTTKMVSNADRIRSMNDEELAEWIDSVLNQDREDWDVPGCYSCINYGTHHSNPENKGTYLYECADCPYEGSYENGLKYGVRAWLRQPAKEEQHETD